MIEKYIIDSEREADDYLTELFAKEEYISMREAEIRAQKLIKDDRLRKYFLNKAQELLSAQPTSTSRQSLTVR